VGICAVGRVAAGGAARTGNAPELHDLKLQHVYG
jgi:hypothetical protein